MDSSLRRRRGLSGLIGFAGWVACGLLVQPAGAQQVIAGKGAVTIDLGVLNQIGQPVAGSDASSGQASTHPGTMHSQPADGQPYGGLISPPQQFPVSTLIVQPPAGSVSKLSPASTGSVPTAPASTGSLASSAETPPPLAPATTAVPMATDTATTPAKTLTDNNSTAAATATTPAVPEPTPLAATTTPGATAATDANSIAATQLSAAGTEGGTDTTDTTGNTTAVTTGATAGPAGETQTASIRPTVVSEGQIRIAFSANSAELPDAVKAELDALAQKMASHGNMRVQLLAYASGTPETASRARRMSLSRALSVRSYLIKQGVSSERMDVRALGNNIENSPADRVDIIPKAQ